MKITTGIAALLVGINLVLICIETMKKLLGKRKLLFKIDKLKAMVLYLSLLNKASNKIATARNLGKEEGLAEGEYKKALETTKKMLEKGLDISLIAQCTDLSEEV